MKFVPAQLSSYTADTVAFVKDHISSLPINNLKHVNDVLSGTQKKQTLETGMNYLHELQRLQWIITVNGANSKTLTAIEKSKTTWKYFQSLPFTPTQVSDLGKKLYDCGEKPGDSVALIVNDYSRGYSEQVLKNCLLNANEVGIHFNDDWAKDLALSQCRTEEQAQALAYTFRKPWDVFDRRLVLKSVENSFNIPDGNSDSELFEIMSSVFEEASSEREKANKHKLYTLTSMPCPQHAALDGISHKELLFYYYNMCMFDMQLIDRPHKAIKPVLDKGNQIVIKNNHGTYLTASLRLMTVADSRVLRNLPGSELYTAPIKDSVNGVFASEERYAHQGEVMEGLHIEFKDGRIINFKAKKGYDVLAGIINTDEGSHYLGEFGFGTNFYAPNYQPSLNIMGEKRVGFHIAIGKSYTDKTYNGVPVNIDNGNVSKIHKDLTLNMKDAKGEICVDGQYIMKDGLYVLPGTEILNSSGPIYR